MSIREFTKPLTPLRKMSAEAKLSKQVRSRGVITTWAELVERRLAEGSRLEMINEIDEVEQRKLQAEYDRTKNCTPTGNQKHPKTIRLNEVKRILSEGGPVISRRCLVNTDGTIYEEKDISKTVMDYAEFLTNYQEATNRVKGV